jgi:hypothetical protein
MGGGGAVHGYPDPLLAGVRGDPVGEVLNEAFGRDRSCAHPLILYE